MGEDFGVRVALIEGAGVSVGTTSPFEMGVEVGPPFGEAGFAVAFTVGLGVGVAVALQVKSMAVLWLLSKPPL